MKKRIIVYAACIAVAGMYTVEAQTNSKAATTQEAPVGSTFEVPAPPPEPPVPPIPPLPPVPTDEIDATLPAPPPPPPPLPPIKEIASVSSTSEIIEIVNSNGYDISVHTIKGVKTVIVKKDGKEQRIKLSTWMANRKYYEKKYGMLPPPPPPKPVEEVKFTPPVIKEDKQ